MTTVEKDNFFLQHILEAIDNARLFTESISQSQFAADYKTQAAVIRQFEIIGEAANKLSADIKDAHPEIDWSKVIAMRNVLIHHYFEVDIDIVWDTIHDDLPTLREFIEKIWEEK